jgi:hypothetical protein
MGAWSKKAAMPAWLASSLSRVCVREGSTQRSDATSAQTWSVSRASW